MRLDVFRTCRDVSEYLSRYVIKETKNFCRVKKSPGLVVMKGDSCSKGHEFVHRLLDGHFSHTCLL